MKNLYNLFFLLMTSAVCNAQISSVDTVCTNVPVAFTGPANNITYTWVMDSVNINQTRGTFSTASLTGFNKATFASTVYDNGTWYTFINDHPNNTMRRLTYTSDPNGAYSVSTVGTYGTAGRLEGIDIVKDPSSGNWYGLTANGIMLYVLSFGSSLANTPTSSSYNFSGVMNWPHQVGLAKYGNNWIGFIGDRGSTIKRVDFGTSLANTPSMTTIPNVGSVSQPCNFALHKENGNWYMLVTSLTANRLTRYNFGTSISNNSPTGTLLGNPGSLLSICRSVCIVSDCDQLIAYVLNENNGLIKLDFGTSITNTSPSASATGVTGIGSQNSMNTYFVDTAMYANIVSFGSNSLSRGRLLTFPPQSTTKYYNNAHAHSFNTAGTKNITLYVNMSSFMGAEVYCKPLVVKGGKTLQDTTMCANDSVTLDASAAGAATYTWSTGATTPGIVVGSPGTYWVKYTGATCVAGDTAVVSSKPVPLVSLGADVFVCDTNHILSNQVANVPGASYLWSTGSTATSIASKTTGQYWLHITKDGCTGKDTVSVNVTNIPKVFLGNDTAICEGAAVILANRINTPAGISYMWSTGSTARIINVMQGTHWLTIQQNGCTESDTITVSQIESPKVSLGNDTGMCEGASMVLSNQSATATGTSYQWSTGDNTNTLKVSPGTYWLTVNTSGCTATDTIHIIQYEAPLVLLGNDTSICNGHEITLRSNAQPVGYSYKWSTGSTADTAIIQAAGTYQLTVTDFNSCEGNASIKISEYKTPSIWMGDDKNLCDDERLYLPVEVVANDGYSIQWQNGSIQDSFIVDKEGTYKAILTDVCGTVTDDVDIEFTVCKLFFPSAFSPNNDNTNDIARMRGDLEGIQKYELSIYNRWGQRVYNTTDKMSGWDGAYNGTRAEMSTYYYLIQLIYRGKEMKMKGNITLVR